MIDEHAHARRRGQQALGGRHALEAVLHDDHRHAVDERGVRRDRVGGILRLRADEHELGALGQHLAGARRALVRLAVAAAQSRMPPARIAARLAPRAVTSTSWPARASSTAKVPPSAPAPMIPILTAPA